MWEDKMMDDGPKETKPDNGVVASKREMGDPLGGLLKL